MLIPYRVKNPVKRFPYATLSIIAVNVLVYAFTTDYFLAIRDGVVEDYSFALGLTPFLNFFSASFLHGDILHLAGNMLFLWVFGPPVEDRLGVPRYIALYFVTGFVGDLLQAMLEIIVIGIPQPVFGASGSIMGVVGAYWYLYSWSTVCVFSWIGWEVRAFWFIGFYILLDLYQGLRFGATGISGGVASFAHVGGGVAGTVLCLLMRAKRDTPAISDAKAIQADSRDLESMPLDALETMMEEDPSNRDLIRAAIGMAVRLGRQSVIDSAMSRAGPALIDKDPPLVGRYLAVMRGDPSIYTSGQLLRLAGLLESCGQPDWAMMIYRTIAETRTNDPESEAALYRCAQCSWSIYKDAQTARNCLNELARRYPHGEMLPFARALWRQIGG